MSQQTLDCRNIHCPLPIVRMTQAVRSMASGEELEVLATDAAFEPDLEAWSRKTGHEIVHLEVGDIVRAVVRVK
ncbi:MAG: sulfurtransferase TusA family protein [Planctomycetaceae bacterium]|nr:sulfurtransferase TusA family protein [Planctomycetaceae bacterium]